jgi:hypothetical protein
MFGRWGRKQAKPLPGVALPDLDREVSARWNPAAAPAWPDKSAENSLDFGPAKANPARTRERSRRRRRVLMSCLLGLVLGPAAVAGFFFSTHRYMSLWHDSDALGERLFFGAQDQEEIYYAGGVSEEQARRLGAFLQREGLFGDERPKSVRLSKDGDVFVVGFALEWNNWTDERVADDFRDLLPRLSHGVFDGGPVEIHLCARQPDSKGRPMPTMRVIRAVAEP